MIRIKKIISQFQGRSVISPERLLTKEEEKTIIAGSGDSENYIYFQVKDKGSSEYLAYEEAAKATQEPAEEEKITADKIDVASIIVEIQKTHVLTLKAK